MQWALIGGLFVWLQCYQLLFSKPLGSRFDGDTDLYANGYEYVHHC